jgi:apolipoprotein N-acyltransferase
MKNKNLLPLVWFVLGFGIFMSTRASHIIPHWSAAIVVAPIFILAFGRSLSKRKSNWLTLLGFLLSCNIAMWGIFEMDTPTASMIYNTIRSSIIGLLFSIPYMVDRALYPKLSKAGGWSTLSFPIAQTAVIFLISLEGPFDGDMISAVYSGFGGIVIRQIASLAGLFGFVFIYSWLASVLNYAWEKEFKWAQIKSAVLAIAFVLVALILFGTFKTSVLTKSEQDTVKVAAIFLLPEEGKAFDPNGLFSKEPSDYDATLAKIAALTTEAASNGAKIVAFQESALKVNETNESKMVADFTAIAVENDVYFSIGYGVFPAEGKGWNKAVLISDDGEVGVDYRKRYLLGFGDIGESVIYNKGAEIIQSVDSPYGRIGVSICRDMSFPGYARQAGEQQVDIMLNPSYDVPKSSGAMYSLRAVENGFNMIRPVYNGYSYAVDANGKLLTSMDSDLTDTGIMYAKVPTQGVNTLYSKIGDLLGWICVIGFLGFLPLNIILRRKQKRLKSNKWSFIGRDAACCVSTDTKTAYDPRK